VSSDDVKADVEARFGQFAQNYVNSAVHAGGSDLDRMIEVAAAQPTWLTVDVATGGGHTALRMAQHARKTIATDFGMTMLSAARDFIIGTGAANLTFVGADAERLPFADNSVDCVTCRHAAHHFPDTFRFVMESARVLKPGGTLVVLDHLIPETQRDMDYIEAFERLRDPGHHRAFNMTEWQGMLLDADLQIEHVESMARPAELQSWAERIGCTPETIEKLRIMLAQAPQAVADFIHPRSVLSPDAGFDHIFILITGRKPG
jgi:ubiquinone/menaquinone biosynthesis C-methylase UbiE